MVILNKPIELYSTRNVISELGIEKNMLISKILMEILESPLAQLDMLVLENSETEAGIVYRIRCAGYPLDLNAPEILDEKTILAEFNVDKHEWANNMPKLFFCISDYGDKFIATITHPEDR